MKYLVTITTSIEADSLEHAEELANNINMYYNLANGGDELDPSVIAVEEEVKPEINDMDTITVFKNKLQAFAKAAEELDNAWDYVDGDAQVVNALIALDEESIAWPFKKQLYYLALKDAHVWANLFASKLK